MKLKRRLRQIYRRWISTGISLVIITFLIYYTESLRLPFFATLRYLYAIPITYVALRFGRRYGLGLALLVTSLFLPILIIVLMDKGWQSIDTIELVMTLVLFNVLAALGGDLADREVLAKERYRTLNYLGEQFSHNLHTDELAQVILTETMRALPADSGELWLCETNGKECRSLAQEGPVPATSSTLVRAKTASGTPPTGDISSGNLLSLVEWVLRYNTPLCVENPDVDPHFAVIQTQPAVRDVLAMPLRSSGMPFGAIILYNRRFRTFTQRDTDLLAEIAIKSEMALENALLYHTLEERVQQRTRDLAEEKNKLAVVFQSIADGLVVLDREQHVLMVNPVVANFINRDAESLVGQLAWDVFPSPALQTVVTQALADNEPVLATDLVLPTGTVLRASVGLLNDASSQVLGVVLVLRDVTHELEVTRMKSDFVTMVSHELRTPLTGILGFARLIRKQMVQFPPDELAPGNAKWEHAAQRIRDNLAVIDSEGKRLTRLIADVLDLTRLEDERMEWSISEVDLAEVVEQAVAAIQDIALEKGLTLVCKTPSDPPLLLADHGRLAQVMDNLLSNALKFTDAGRISVDVWRIDPGDDIPAFGLRAPDAQTGLPVTQPMLVVSVRDTGVGVAEKDLPQIFEKFKQAGDRREGTRRRGTGLGLAICREIIAHHNGHIWLESRLGEGSRFVFTLPLEEDSSATPA